jgi:hypothetical protein
MKLNEYKKVINDNNDLQASDGSINYNAILKVLDPEEDVEIKIREDSLIRVMYVSKEINRAKVLLLSTKNSQDAIAQTAGKDKSESFIARLRPREQSYIIKLIHTNLKPICNRYQLKISIEPLMQVSSSLGCDVKSSNLPNDVIDIYGNDSFDDIKDKWFLIPDKYIQI